MSKKSSVKSFNYTDAKGKQSFRTAYVLHGASDLALMIDLTEFDEDEQGVYEEIIDNIREDFFSALHDAGLGGNIRTFKESKMVMYEDVAKKANLAGHTA